jgi:hypothetical protein
LIPWAAISSGVMAGSCMASPLVAWPRHKGKARKVKGREGQTGPVRAPTKYSAESFVPSVEIGKLPASLGQE